MLNKLWYVHLPRSSHFLANSNKKASKIKKMWKAWTGTEPNCWNRYSLSSDTLDSVKRYAYWAIVCSFLHFLLARTYQFIISASVYHVTLNTMHNSRCFSGICSKPKHPTWMQYKIPPEWTLCRAMSSSRAAFSFSCLEAPSTGREIMLQPFPFPLGHQEYKTTRCTSKASQKRHFRIAVMCQVA